MAANKKFTPRASSNLIGEEVVKEETSEVVSDEVVEEPEKVIEDDKEDAEVETPSIIFSAETEKKPIERMVKIRLAKKYDGCIGGEWYHFVKDQVVNVPENVKRILNNTEGMLKPL